MLQELGAQMVSQANNAREAINLCKNSRFDVVFCDYNLGDGQDGQQILEELNLRGLISVATLFLMVTAETSSSQVLGALEYQPDAYITKPFTRQQLEQRLRRLLARNAVLKPIHDAMLQESYLKAIMACEAVIEQYPAVRFATLRLKAECLEKSNQIDEALNLYNRVVEEQPLLWAMVGLGRISFKKKDYQNSLTYFKETLQEFPSQATVLDWIAKCHSAMGMNVEAENQLKDAIGISPKNVRRQSLLGEVAQTLGHFELAHKAYGKAIKEGAYSCIIDASHYQHYFDITAELVMEKQGKDLMRLLEDTELCYKRVESMHAKDAAKLACVQASVAKLYQNADKESQTSKYVSKLAKTLDRPNCEIDNETYQHIENALKVVAQNEKFSSSLKQLHDDLDLKKQVYEETLPEEDNHSDSETVDARLLNREGMQLAKAKRELEALQKYNQAIAIEPENFGYRLNAVQVIAENKMLMNNAKYYQEAKEHLQMLGDTMDQDDERWKRYEALKEKLENA